MDRRLIAAPNRPPLLNHKVWQKFFRQFALRDLVVSATPGLELLSAGYATPKINNFIFTGDFRPFGLSENRFAACA